jgi:hypothetical protein
MRITLVLGAAMAMLAPAAQARAAEQTLRLRVPVPAARDLSVMAFELRIGGEGRHHRKQPVRLDLVNHKQTGVFALARLRPQRGHPGRFLGLIEVFHRGGATATSLPSGPAALSRSSPFARAQAATPVDEFLVRADNEHLIKEVIKDNVVALAEAHDVGPDEFCDPLDPEEYLLGNELIGGAYVLAGFATGLPTNTSIDDLIDDAVNELCDEVEEEDLGPSFQVGTRYIGVKTLLNYLGAKEPMPTTPTPIYHLEFTGAWSFEGTAEVKLVGMFTGTYLGSGAPPATSTAPVEAIEIVLPAAGSMPRAVSNDICPSQLPIAAITTTKTADDTLTCSGGTLPLNQTFTVNVQTQPLPSSGMGGSLLAQQNGAYLPAFTLSGP